MLSEQEPRYRRLTPRRTGPRLRLVATHLTTDRQDPNGGDHCQTGEDVRRERVRVGLTQVQLANLVGIDPGSISRIERGEFRPRPDTLAAINDALRNAEQQR